jgi:hypothetical protein
MYCLNKASLQIVILCAYKYMLVNLAKLRIGYSLVCLVIFQIYSDCSDYLLILM